MSIIGSPSAEGHNVLNWQERYRDFCRTSRDAVFVITKDGRWIDFNEAAVDLFGYESRDALGQVPIHDLYADPADFATHLETFEGQGLVGEYPADLRRRDGEIVHALITSVAIENERGDLVGVQGTIREVPEQDQVADLLHEQRDLPGGVLEAIPASIVVFDRRGRLCYANDRAVGALGLDTGDIDDRPYSDPAWTVKDSCGVPLPDDRLPFRRVVETGQPIHDVEYTVEGPGDGRRRLSISGAPIRDESGRIAWSVFTVEDVSERAQAQRALQESEERLKQIVEGTEALLMHVDRRGRLTYLNEAAEEKLGYPSEDLVGALYLRFVHPEDRDRVGRAYSQQMEAGTRSTSLEFRIVTRDDGVRWVRFLSHPIVRDGQVVELAGFALDVTERKKAQEALHESQRRLTTLMSNLPGMAYRCNNDRNWTMEFVSEGCCALTGYQPEELIDNARLSYTELIVPEDRDDVWDGVQEALAERQPFELTYRIVAADGEEKWVWEQGRGLFDEDGWVTALEGFITDITERKRAEEALRESEARYRDIFESAGVPIWEEDFSAVKDAMEDLKSQGVEDFRQYLSEHPEFVAEAAAMIEVRDVNQATLRMLGAEDKAEVLGSVDDVFTAETEDIFREELIAIAEGKTYFEGETVNRTLQGERRHVLLTMSIPTGRDRLDSVLVSTMDITERKRAQEALRESERKFRLVTETIKDVFWMSTPGSGEMVYISPAYETLWERSRESLYESPRSFLEALHPDDVDGYLEVFREHHAAGKAYECEYRLVRKNEEVRWIHERGYPVPNPSGDVELMTGVCTDVTERRQMTEQLRQQEQLAAVGQLAGGIAHDFNNILASILLYAQMPLARPDLDARTKQVLDIIVEESNRAADLVDQILDFSRRAMMDVETLRLVALVEDALSILRRTIPEDIVLTANLGEDACVVEADATRLHQVLMNLAVNARDAMPDGGRLEVGVKRITFAAGDEAPLPDLVPGDWARLQVSDTGTGMTEEVEEHLFEPFFTTKEEGKGTGLGLAQVYGIVKQHEGYIDVETAPGEGSTFTIYLPVVGDDEDEADDDDTEGPALKGRGETILVVEDAEQILQGIKAGLENLGYRVLTAASGREALETAPLEEVDLVLTDVVMPEMGGEDLLRALKEEAPGLKTIAMTGYVIGTRTEDLREIGFSAMISKPFSIEELTEAIRGVLDT